MQQQCEVCESFRPRGDLHTAREVLEVPFLEGQNERRVLLCSGHARIALNSHITTLDELRTLYGESAGQRSYIARRARGVRSRGTGRRATDLTP